MKSLLLHFLILLFAPFAWSAELPFLQDELQKLSESKQWLRLIHMKPNFWGRPEGQLDGQIFYLSPEGKTNSLAELKATLENIFFEDPSLPEEKSLKCRFPARNLFLKESLGQQVQKWPDRSCPRLERWFSTVRGVSVSLVFSSYYLNNPASTFGHTFLRINKAASEKTGQRYELLDYGLNFAANPGDMNPAMYAISGVFGFFPGTFTIMPYYYKVREYNNAESRDLWEYELSLSQKGVDLMTLHIWEAGASYADYWYFTENCSYFILTMLEVADPNLELTSRLNWEVIPSNTVHVVWETPGLVRSFRFRPSTRAELEERLKDLNQDEKSLVARSVKAMQMPSDLKSRPEGRQRRILDTMIDFTDFLYSGTLQDRESPPSRFKSQILARRSELDEISPPLVVQPAPTEFPHLGHPSRRWGLGVFSDQKASAGALYSFKAALHDFADPVTGYPSDAQITFLDLQFQHFERERKFQLKQFGLFEVTSLSPLTEFNSTPSWGVKLASELLGEPDCLDCQSLGASGRIGATFLIDDSPRWIFFAGARGGTYVLPSKNRWSLQLGPALTSKIILTPKWSAILEGWTRLDLSRTNLEKREFSLATQWSPSRNWGFRFSGVDRWFEKRINFETFLYY